MYTLESRVRYSECDEHGNLALVSLINYLQDCTTFHSEEIARGVDYMKQRGIAWLIAAWQIEIRRLPRFCEQIRVSTWCHTMARTLATRNFVISDLEGHELVRADSLWFVFDFAAKRPIRVPNDQLVYLSDEEPLDMPPTKRRLPVEGEGHPTSPIVVSEVHLDTNGHVNNAQYLNMAVSALSELAGDEGIRTTADIGRICVQYKRQARAGDTIVPSVHGQAGHRTIVLGDDTQDPFAVVRLELR